VSAASTSPSSSSTSAREPENTARRPLVLLSNDDGYASRGLRALFDALKTWADVIHGRARDRAERDEPLAQPSSSAARAADRRAHLRDRRTPADCVYVALHAETRFLPRWPDIVCSGINRGLNLGQDAFYSGTVAAAREGALRGIPALASSAITRPTRRTAALTSTLARELFEETKATSLPRAGALGLAEHAAAQPQRPGGLERGAPPHPPRRAALRGDHRDPPRPRVDASTCGWRAGRPPRSQSGYRHRRVRRERRLDHAARPRPHTDRGWWSLGAPDREDSR